MTSYIPPAVLEELTRNSLAKTRLEAAIRSGKAKVVMPSSEALLEVKDASSLMGDSYLLSEADIQVLALALDLKKEGDDTTIVTDDYSIQNVADKIRLNYKPLITFGIRKRILWKRYCPACYKSYPQDYPHRICQVCGTPLKRKPIRKTR